MQNFANDNSVSMRPHSKTNKSPYWAKKQIEAGAIGICCAKLGEAEMMAAGGVKEILIPNQIVTPEKIKRLVEVNKKSKVMIAVENYDNVSKLSEEFEKNSMKLGVIIEVNVGMDRCGVELDEIVDFAKNINDKSGLDFEGIMGYEGHTVNIGNFEDRVNETTKAMNKLIKAKDILEENNIFVMTSSNFQPTDLYKNGLQRERFISFISLVEKYFDIREVSDGKDYRIKNSKFEKKL